MITRRRFIQASTAAGAMLAWPIRAFPFSQSVLEIKKFAVPLPLLGNTGIPVLTPSRQMINGVATDVYTIDAAPFEQDLLGAASSLGVKQKLWGYAGAAPGSPRRYLGGVIVATGGKSPVPVELRVINKLPAKHVLPVDTTLIDPVSGEAEFGGRHDRIAIHLHGGFVFWCFDGTPFTWFSNPANGGFVHGSSFIPENQLAAGEAVYHYPNQQSARTIWYHDHAYGLTRTNVYAGLASAYLITDNDADGEAGLISNGIIPGKGLTAATGLLGFPVIIQDKTFWDPASDPNYAAAVPAGAVKGDLWYPHVYEGATVDNLPEMILPPNAGATTAPTARWELGTGTPPAISSVPEFFSDTILVNGAPYPTLAVNPQRYRFRFLNASQARFYNLQMYVGEPGNPDGITLLPIGDVSVPNNLDNNGNVLLIPQNAAGPGFIQIANEAGFLPAPALFSVDASTNLNSNKVIKYSNATDVRTHRRRADGPETASLALPGDPTVGNVNQHNLLIAPAERPDVIVDFRGFEGQDIILYNDAPAPFPGGDTRNDYFVLTDAAGLGAGYNDLTSIGGAPAPLPGNGPDTRVLMKFVVSNATATTEPDFAQTVKDLQDPTKGLPFVFKNTQPSTNLTPTVTVNKTLNEDKDEFGRLRQLLGVVPLPASQTYLDFPTEIAKVGEVQEWKIYNLTADTHPMHFHLVNVHVVKRERWAFNPDGTPKIPLSVIPNSALPVDANEAGWKETVRMNPGEVTTVVMQFTLPTGAGAGTPPPNSPRLLASYGIKGAEYVWHCHILEHEEHDMMHAVVVVP